MVESVRSIEFNLYGDWPAIGHMNVNFGSTFVGQNRGQSRDTFGYDQGVFMNGPEEDYQNKYKESRLSYKLSLTGQQAIDVSRVFSETITTDRTYFVTGDNCVDFAQKVYVAAGGLGHVGDSFTVWEKLQSLAGFYSLWRVNATDNKIITTVNDGIQLAPPLVLDLDGDGIELVNLDESAVFFDIDGDGFLENTGWADGAAGDGILVIDLAADGTSGADGVIERADEIVITLHAEGAAGDLEALALAFDSNLDGVFDANDARFNEFRIWVDGDMDGEVDSGELDTLANHGVTSIDLDGIPFIDSTGSTGPKDNIIHNTAAYTKADGTTAQVGDIGFVYSTYGYQWDDAAEGGVRLNAEYGSILPVNDNRILEVA